MTAKTRSQRVAGATLAGVALLAGFVTPVLSNDLLIERGSVWQYWDAGTLPAANWTSPAYDDSGWQSGPAQLGYTEGDEATLVSYGPDSSDKHITTYFRHTFAASNLVTLGDLVLRLVRDDGAAVYLNGKEILRDNLPEGPLSNSTRASTTAAPGVENIFHETVLPGDGLVEGQNVIAVEVHQKSPTSSDISFDLELEALEAPIEATLVGPAPETITDETFASLAVQVSDWKATNLTVTFHGRRVVPNDNRDFTLIAFPDTQNYVDLSNAGVPETFYAQSDWMIANQAERNIVFMTLLGDCVQNGDNVEAEWLFATNALYRLEDPQATLLPFGIQYGVAVGNHDQSPFGDTEGTTLYNKYFGADHFEDYPYYGGHHGEDNDNHYELFSGGGMEFIIIHLEYDTTPDAAVLDWANDLLQSHPDRRGIISSHYLINKGDNASFGPQGQAVYDALKHNPNLFLMLSGHVPGEGRRQDTHNGNTVHTLLSDYQTRPNGGDGWLRIMEFSPSNNVIRVQTYSPTLDQFETDADSEFTIEYDMGLGGPFQPVSGATAAQDGSMVTMTWTNLNPGTTYEWFVTVTDGQRTTTSETFHFTTGGITPAGGGEPIEEPPLVAIVSPDMDAAESDAHACEIVIARLGNLDENLFVTLEISGSASNGVDVALLPDRILIPAGSPSAILSVLPQQDNASEGMEEVVITLTDQPGYTVAPAAQVSVMIADADVDTDKDGQNDAAEVMAGTDWNDAQSVLKFTGIEIKAGEIQLTWDSVPGKVYKILSKQQLSDPDWTELSPDLTATTTATQWSYPPPPGQVQSFYILNVR